MNGYRQYRFLIPVFLLSLWPLLGRAQGQSYTAIYTFNCNVEGCNAVRPAMLAQGTDGNLYGTLPSGANAGSWFEFPMGKSPALTNFGNSGLRESRSGFTLGIDGNLYGGVDHLNGSANPGAIIKLSPPSPGLSAIGLPSVVLPFASWNGSPIPTFPEAPPIQGTDFNLYGVTNDAGSSGTVYQVQLNTSTGQGASGWSHQLPSNSSAPLLLASDGNFYGTYESGTFSSTGVPIPNTGGCGGIFQITPAGVFGWHYNLGANATGEGCGPHGGLIQAADGYLYGTASAGGATSTAVGVVFRIAPNGSGYKIIHSFESADGQTPHGGLVQGSNGFLYGFTTTKGPTSIPFIGSITPVGTLFKVSPDGTIFTVLQPFFGLPSTNNFCGSNNGNCGPGTDPEFTPTLHTNGTLFGLTHDGGEPTSTHVKSGDFDNGGEFFSFNDGLSPFISVVGRRSAHVGDRVGIIGQGFLNATGVTFGGVAASSTKFSVFIWSDNFMSVVVPPGARSGPVTVQETTGNLSTLYNFSIACNYPICVPPIPR